MGTVRTCDTRCHNAKRAACVCWCGGVFHGGAAEPARQAFRETFCAEIPSAEDEARQRLIFAPPATPTAIAWTEAMRAAVKARRTP